MYHTQIHRRLCLFKFCIIFVVYLITIVAREHMFIRNDYPIKIHIDTMLSARGTGEYDFFLNRLPMPMEEEFRAQCKQHENRMKKKIEKKKKLNKRKTCHRQCIIIRRDIHFYLSRECFEIASL